jgi:sigma-B regulation protein RsbU (phosphoserine phosphatase)
VRDSEITEFKPDKMTLGVAPLKEHSFTNQIIDTLPGDRFYLFSDGFSDQFGEQSDKKFKYKQLKRVISSLSGHMMSQQGEMLMSTFLDWKGNTQQIDDVLVFGFQL